VCTDSTPNGQPVEHGSLKPWRSWGTTIRYVIVQLAHSVPTGLLVWLAYIHH
jgi:hypothetical protein